MALMADEVAAYLAAVSPTLGLIKVGDLPATPDVVIALKGYGGAPPDLGFGTPGIKYETPGLQVKVRGAALDSLEPETRAQRVYQAMAKIQGMTLTATGAGSGTKYLICHPQQPPTPLPNDDQDERPVFVCNFLLEKEPTAA